ncbi:MAG: hypothetical protein RPS47_05935 [Colwellia sp.]|jgi:hypothetical protein
MTHGNQKAPIRAHRLEWEAFIAFQDDIVRIEQVDAIALAREYAPEKFAKLEPDLDTFDANYPDLFLDKMGIDFLVEHEGQRYAIDLTTGNRCTVKSKLKNMREILPFIEQLNAIPVVLRSLKGFMPKDVFKLIEDCPWNDGVKDCRLGKDLELVPLS